MNKFEFFSSHNLPALKEQVNGWINDNIQVDSWEFRQTKGLFILVVYYSNNEQAEPIGFKNVSNEKNSLSLPTDYHDSAF
jgi:hypothetical protein